MKISWGKGIAIVYLIFISSMIVFAIKASKQSYDLVSENYYDEAVRFQDQINATANAVDNKNGIRFNYIKAENSLELLSASKQDLIGSLYFYKPDKAGDDFTMEFHLTEAKTFIKLGTISKGLWKVKARWQVNNQNCFAETKLFIE